MRFFQTASLDLSAPLYILTLLINSPTRNRGAALNRIAIIFILAAFTLSFSSDAAFDVSGNGRKLTESEVDAAINIVLVIGESLEVMSQNYMTGKLESVIPLDNDLCYTPHARILYLNAKTPAIELAKEKTSTLSAAKMESTVMKYMGKAVSPYCQAGIMDTLNDPGDTVYGRKAYAEAAAMNQFIIDYMLSATVGTTPDDLWYDYVLFQNGKRKVPPLSMLEESVDTLPFETGNDVAVNSGMEWRRIVIEKGLSGVTDELALYWNSSDKAGEFSKKNSFAKLDYARRYIRTRISPLLATAANRRLADLRRPAAEAIIDMLKAIEDSKLVVKGRLFSFPVRAGTPVILEVRKEGAASPKKLETRTGADGSYAFELGINEVENAGLSIIIAGRNVPDTRGDIRDCSPAMLFVDNGKAVQVVGDIYAINTEGVDVGKLTWDQGKELMDQSIAEIKANVDVLKAADGEGTLKLQDKRFDWTARLSYFADSVKSGMMALIGKDAALKAEWEKYSRELEKAKDSVSVSGLKNKKFEQAAAADRIRSEGAQMRNSQKEGMACGWMDTYREVPGRWINCEAFQMFYDFYKPQNDSQAAQVLQIRKNNAKLCVGSTSKAFENMKTADPALAASIDDEMEKCKAKLKEMEAAGVASYPAGITGSNISSDYEQLRDHIRSLGQARHCMDIMSKWDLNAMQARNIEALKRLKLIE